MTPVCPAETPGVCSAGPGDGHLCCLGEGHPVGQAEHVCDCGVSW